MKKIILVIFFILFVGAAGIGGWAMYAASQTCDKLSAEYLIQIQTIMDEWRDQFTLANSTPRATLSPAIAELQRIKRSTDALVYPECAAKVQTSLVSSMEYTIDGFVLFLGDEPDAQVNSKFESATQFMEWANEAIAEIYANE